MPVAIEVQVPTAFTTPFGLYQETVMPFDLSEAPATFQLKMDQLTKNMEGFVAAYLVIYSYTWEEHASHLEMVFKRSRLVGLQPSKCQLAMSWCFYLDHVGGSGVVRPQVGKVEAMRTFSMPICKERLEDM